MPSHRVFLVDDHPVMREGYASLIGYEEDLDICGMAGTAEEALYEIPSALPDVTLVDLSLPGGSGLELIKHLRARDLGGVLLVVSAHDEALYAERALRAGARGYLMKHESARYVVAALRTVLDGHLYASEAIRHRLLGHHLASDRGAAARPNGSAPSVAALTDRELEVFEQFGHGRTTREIAERLSLSPKTIESRRVSIKQKLGVDSVADMLRHAVLWVEREAS